MTADRPRIQVDLDPVYIRALKIQGAELDKSVGELIMLALDRYMPEIVARARKIIDQHGPPPKDPRGRKRKPRPAE